METDSIKYLRGLAAEIRQDVIRMHQRGSNVASAMSAVDLLVGLYFAAMHIPAPDAPDRDRFVLSKGHAAAALYATLARKGFLDPGLLAEFLADGSPLTGHPPSRLLPGIEAATGSLGHGLSLAAGLALAARNNGDDHRVFVLLGDGELQEGSVWEAANLAARLRLDNLVAIVDANGLQGYDRVDKQMPLVSLPAKWQAFGWATVEIDGHDFTEIARALSAKPLSPGKPAVIIARTVKGKGVREMEDVLGWHYFNVPPEWLEGFLEQLVVQAVDVAETSAKRPGRPANERNSPRLTDE